MERQSVGRLYWRRSLFGLIRLSSGLPTEGNRKDNVRACSVRMDGVVRVYVDGDIECLVVDLEASFG